MKRLLAFLLCAIPAAAQVQINSGVQVGGVTSPNTYADVMTADLIPGTKMQNPCASGACEYQSIGAGATKTLVDYVGSGVVTNVWININGDVNANLTSTINVYYDGNSSPDISVPIAYFFGAPGISMSANNALHSKYFDVTYDSNDVQINYASRLRMPFSTEFKMTITNNGAAITSGLFWNVEYQTGITNNWPNTRHLKMNTLQGTTCTVDQMIDLLNLGSGNAGRFLGVAFYLSGGGSNPNLQEGDFYLFLNGASTADYQSPGFEDFFEQGHNFRGQTLGNALFNQQEGIYLWNGTSFPSDPIGAWRYFVDDPVVYTNGIKWQWQCGESGHGSTGTGTLKVSVYYYTAT